MSEAHPEPDAPHPAQSALIARLSSYAVVNSSWNVLLGGYQAAKTYSPVLKAGLEKAEAAGQYVYSAAEPVVRPVVVSLNEKFALDEKGVKVLDKVETAVEAAKAKVDVAKAKVAEGKEAASAALATGKEAAAARTQQLVAAGNRPLNHFIDLAEIVVDKILPPALQAPPAATDAPQLPHVDSEESVEEAQRLAANPVTRAAALGKDVSKRVRDVAAARLPAFTMRSAGEIAEMTHVIDLIQYAAQFVDNEKARIGEAVGAAQAKVQEVKAAAQTKAQEAKDAAQLKVQEAKDSVAEKIQPIKALVDAHTADLKDAATKRVVAVVAAVAQASEILRRRLGAQSAALLATVDAEKRRQQLQQRLNEVVLQAKAYVQGLNETQLREYLAKVQAQSGDALAALVNLVNQATTTTLSGGLLSWTNSLAARFGYQVVPVTAALGPAEAVAAPAPLGPAPSASESVDAAPGTPPTPARSGDESSAADSEPDVSM